MERSEVRHPRESQLFLRLPTSDHRSGQHGQADVVQDAGRQREEIHQCPGAFANFRGRHAEDRRPEATGVSRVSLHDGFRRSHQRNLPIHVDHGVMFWKNVGTFFNGSSPRNPDPTFVQKYICPSETY